MQTTFNFLCFALCYFNDGAFFSRHQDGEPMEVLLRELIDRQGLRVEPAEFNALVNACILFFEGSENVAVFLSPERAAFGQRIYEAECAVVETLETPLAEIPIADLRRLRRMFVTLAKDAGGNLTPEQKALALDRAREISGEIDLKESLETV